MRATNAMSIGALADQAGCTVPTIRYYEQIGLLPAADRARADSESMVKEIYGG